MEAIAHMSMDKFSDNCKALDQSKAAAYEAALKPWDSYFPYGYSLVELPDDETGLCAKINVDAGSASPLFVCEPVVIGLPSVNIEYDTPKVFPDRLDFPFNLYPHENYADKKIPQTLCLSREPIEEWYAEHTFGEYVELVRQWYDDAAHDKLMKLKNGDTFEPFRLDSFDELLMVQSDIDKNILKEKTCGSYLYQVILDGNKYIEFVPVENQICKEKGLEIILFKSNRYVFKEWFVKYPTTLGGLIDFIDDNGFQYDNTLVKTVICSNGSRVDRLFFKFAFFRPAKVVDKDTPLDYLCFSVSKDDFLNNNVDSKITSVFMYDMLTTGFVNNLTQTPSSTSNKKILVLGCGAIGSKLIFHLYRSGIKKLTICDKDVMLPHNVCRHSLTNIGAFNNKADLIKSELQKMQYVSEPVKTVTEDLLMWLPKTNLSEYDLIIDATASASVSRSLDRLIEMSNVPIVRFALSDSGNVGLVYTCYNRNVAMADYYMQLLRVAVTGDEEVVSWLKKERSYNYDYVRVGEGCHSRTMKLNDDVISAHTALASNIIRHLFENEAANKAYLSFANLDYDGSLFTRDYYVPNFVRISCLNIVDWEVRIPDDLLKQIRIASKVNKNKEIGGYMMGYVDNKYHRIYVLDSFVPYGSIQGVNRIKLSTSGWKEHCQKLKENTAGTMTYIGDWHSHPHNSLLPSDIDDETNKFLINNKIETEYGVCLITNSQHTNAYLLKK